MAYFEDLSDYIYCSGPCHHGAKNVGWLERSHSFEEMVPSEKVLNLLWDHCTISVAQTRGIHECDLCVPAKTVFAGRKGQRVLLGTSEIRVFSPTGQIYAAPTLVYHYAHIHQYKPPEEFLRALGESATPPGQEYLEQLKKSSLEWRKTSSPPINQSAFKFEKIDGEIRRVEVQRPVYLDES